MTTLTLAKLTEIEAAAAQLGPHDRACDPATVAALCRIARAAVEWERMSASPPEWDDFEQAETDLSDALRDAGLLE